MAARSSLKWWLHAIGGGLGLAGVLFVLLRLYSYAEQIDLSRFNITAWSIIALLALAYGSANVLLARAWWHLLIFFEMKTDWMWAFKVYGQSQLAKYVPGNIFHLAGRQVLGMAVGLSAQSLLKSAVWEMGLIAVAGALFGTIALPLVWAGLSLWVSLSLFAVITAALFATTRRLLSPAVAVALIWQISFLVMSGLVFLGTLAVVVPTATLLPAFPFWGGAYVFAWLAGLFVPGSPAGMGVREMVLLLLLGGQIAQGDLLLAVVLGRGITLIGDILFFIVASAMNMRGVDLPPKN